MEKNMIAPINNKEVEDRIEIRSPLSIYAFRTNTIPAYLKVGDTFRPVDTRISEWLQKLREKVSDSIELTKEGSWKAMLDDEDVYFRDYAVHRIFDEKGKERLSEEEQRKYSKEFFKDVTPEDVSEAIETIKQAYRDESARQLYQYYKLEDRGPRDFQYSRNENWSLRANQQKVVDAFEEKVNAGIKKLLMYAVMRFGKSFTAISCAQRMGYKKVLVVSAKADVAGEWKKTVEKPICFDKFKFLSDADFRIDDNAIETNLNNADECKCVVVFLTLQNLSGKANDGEDIKARLAKVMKTKFDLLIVDETHYGAWAEKYGASIKDEDYDTIEDDIKEHKDFLKKSKAIKADVKLHLSGTPYSLLYDNEFNEENTIATCQFSDILEAKEAWNERHFEDIENGKENPCTGRAYEEFDNPYFGFPKMLRFGFNLPQRTREKLKEYKKEGVSWSLRDFLTVKDGKFLFEEDVIHLLKIIDGTAHDDGILSFLNVEKIRENDVCKHIVMALPFKKSCDAMERLLNDLKGAFANLGEYHVLNVAGNKTKKPLKSTDGVKKAISNHEKNGEKTITLTVNKMLTGVTVKEWDTMIMLKSTHSAQEYDQAIFRIQSQYVKEDIDENGNVLFKKDMKPQTILVDFDPIRVLEVQGRAASIVNNYVRREGSLDDAIAREIKYLSTMVYAGDQLVEVTPNNILDVLVKYNSEKSIMDMASKVRLADSIKSNPDLLEYISKQSSKGISNPHLEMEAHKSDKTSDVDSDDQITVAGEADSPDQKSAKKQQEKEQKDLEKKYKNCIAKIYFYAFLSKSKLFNLQDLLNSVKNNSENKRIFKHLGLDKGFIKGLLKTCSKLYLDDLNQEIIQIQRLSNDETLTEEQRIDNAMKRFSIIGDAEVVTPQDICKEMLNCIGEDKLIEIVNRDGKILDIASKTGEFSVALYWLLKDKVDKEKLKNAIYVIPTSTSTYEFTRKAFENIGLNVDHLAKNITSYSLLNYTKIDKKGNKTEELDYDKVCEAIKEEFSRKGKTDMIQFDAVVGNPPYQGIAADTSEPAIYHHFVDISYQLSHIACMITPAKFLFNAGKTPKEWNQRMLHDEHLEVIFYEPDNTKVFPETGAKGGIAITYRDENQTFGQIGTFTAYPELNSILHKVVTPGFESIKSLVFAPESYRLSKKLHKDHPEIAPRLSNGHTYDVTTNIFSKLGGVVFDECPNDEKEYVQLIGLNETQRVYKWIQRDYLDSHRNLDRYKIIIPKSNGSGSIGEVLSTPLIGEPLIGEPLIGHTQTFISIGAFETLFEAQAAFKYIKTKFARALLGTLKVTQDNKKDVWTNVPLQDFTAESDIDWSKSIPEIDRQLYAKYHLDESEIAFIESMIKPME